MAKAYPCCWFGATPASNARQLLPAGPQEANRQACARDYQENPAKTADLSQEEIANFAADCLSRDNRPGRARAGQDLFRQGESF